MTELTIFKNGTSLPTNFSEDDFAINKSMASNSISLTPMIKLDGKTFILVHNGEKEQLGLFINGIIVGDSPESRRYYKAEYTGSDEDAKAPDCASINGLIPDKAIAQPVCESCAVCPNAAYGSKINARGKKTCACTKYKRLVIYIPPKNDSAPKFFRLDVPLMSLKSCAEYSAALFAKDVPVSAVITRFAFDTKETYPRLTFDAMQVFTLEQFANIRVILKDPEIQKILTAETISMDEDAAETNQKSQTNEEVKPKLAKKVIKPAANVETSHLEIAPGNSNKAIESLNTELNDMLESME